MGRGGNSATLEQVTTRASVPVIKTKLYRAGTLEKVNHYGEAEEAFVEADKHCPQERVGRKTGLFCGAGLTDLGQWMRGNYNAGKEYSTTPNEFNYNGPEPYIYPADAWLIASSKFNASRRLPEKEKEVRCKQIFEEYWSTGILLSDYRSNQEKYSSGVWRGGGEILIDPQHVTSARRVSQKRLIEANEDYHHQELKNIYKQLR